MICLKSDERSAEIAADYLKRGKVIIVPTDTVYGFSGIVSGRHFSYETKKKIARIKGRDEEKPLIRLISDPSCLKKYSRDVVPQKLLDQWPGPLTIIVHTFDKEDNQITTAFRCPGDEWLRKVIALCGAPIYSTSVNKAGEKILDTIDEIIEVFGKTVDLIISDGDKKNAKPSKIVAIEEDGSVKIIRE